MEHGQCITIIEIGDTLVSRSLPKSLISRTFRIWFGPRSGQKVMKNKFQMIWRTKIRHH